MAMSERRRQELLPYELLKARHQQRRPCREHGAVVILCMTCAKRYCPYCGERCPKCKAPPRPRQVQALSSTWQQRQLRKIDREFGEAPLARVVPKQYRDPRLKQIFAALQPMGVLEIEPHTDSGHWMAVFPMEIASVQNSEDLATLVERLTTQWALPTPFGAGRMFRPDRRFATFQLR